MWAARPHLGSIFEKLLYRKTFYLPAARIFKTHFKINLENFFQNGIGIRCHCFRFNQIRCNGIRFTIQFSPNFLDPFKSVQQFCLMRNDKIAVLHDLPDFCPSTLRHRQRICSFRESCLCKRIRNGRQLGCNIQAAGEIKVFRCSSFSKMLPRCGRAAHICGANLFL